MSTSDNTVLPAQVRVVIETLGQRSNKRAVRRPILIDRSSGLVHELPTVHVYRDLRGKSLNTQRAALQDLAFYLAWAELKRKRNINWISPEVRVREGQLALTSREIDDLSIWCQRYAADLAHALQREKPSVSSIAAGRAADAITTNRRIHTISNYLAWLTREFIEGTIRLQDQAVARSAMYQKRLRTDFEKNLNAVRKASPIRSLDNEESAALRSALQTSIIFPNTPQGKRDQLIARLLLTSGLRSGELLKLCTTDVDDNYKVSQEIFRGIVNVVRRPNDAWDERRDEPSVKTFPGPVQIPRELASDIKAYIIGDRRIALDRRTDEWEHAYLFVCHSGPHTGKPISRRNLNRIIAKLKEAPGVPKSVSPHVLRHTHFTEFADYAEEKGKGSEEIHALLIKRGHWAPESKMPEHYTKRRIERQEAELTAERDRIIAPKEKH